MARQIYRQEALERLQSPEELDRLLVVVNRKAWLILATLVALCCIGIVWSFLGRIPVSVDGFGVLVNPGNVKALQTPASGQITSIAVRVGQHVNKGELIARLDQPELRKQLEQLEAKREDTLAFHKTAVELDERRVKLETNAYEKQRVFIMEEVKKSGELASRLDDRGEAFISEQRKNLQQATKLTSQLNESLKKRLATLKQLKLEGLSSQDLVLNAESSMTSSELQLANMQVQMQELELSEIQRERSQLEQQNRLADLALELMQLDIASQRLAQEQVQNQEQRKNELLEIDNAIVRVKLRLQRESQIISDCDGTILEVSVQPGQVVGLGTRVGTIEQDDPDAVLTNLSFFSIRDGKRIAEGDIARVTPSTVEREREGSILGKVQRVSAFPITQESVVNEVGNAQIAETLLHYIGFPADCTIHDNDCYCLVKFKALHIACYRI